MPDTKISAESAASAFDGTELVPVVQSAANAKATTQQFADLGGLILVSTLTASSSASLDFTGLSGGSENYRLVGSILIPASAGSNLQLRVGTGGTPTYQTTGYNYSGLMRGSGGFSTDINGENQGQIPLSGGIATTAGFGGNFDITVAKNYFVGTHALRSNDGHDYWVPIQGHWDGGTAFTAIRVMMNSGNIASGSVSLYRMRT